MKKDNNSKDDKLKDNISYIIVGIIFFAIVFPWIIDAIIFGNNVYSNISNGEWAGFLGSYIGGICTLIAVFISIKDNNKKNFIQKKENDSIRKEEKRLLVQPYIASDYKFYKYNDEEVRNVFAWFTIDVVPIVDNGTEVNKVFASFSYSCPIHDGRQYYTPIVCKMRNAGAGSAVEGQLTVSSETANTSLSLIIAKDETTNFVIYNALSYKGWIEVGYYYRDIADIGRYKLVDKIRFFQNESNTTVIKFQDDKKNVQELDGV